MRLGRCERCVVCNTPHEDDLNDPWRYTDSCAPCLRMEQSFERRFGFSGDADYLCHELAHFILRYGKLPRRRADWRRMDRELSEQPVGRAQLHELRVLALQGLTYIELGWKLSWKRLVGLSWPGLDEAAQRNGPESYLRGAPVVTTERAARDAVRSHRGDVSRRKVQVLAHAITAFRTVST